MRSVRISQQLPIAATMPFELFDSDSGQEQAFSFSFSFFYSVFCGFAAKLNKREKKEGAETGRGVKKASYFLQ
jgi:hypothetical protein